jgi:hypothetical protein
MMPVMPNRQHVSAEYSHMELSEWNQIHANTNTPKCTEIDSRTQSRLLALPTEIRYQIYELVLGGNWLHVCTEGRTVRLCLNPHRFRLRYQVIKSSPTRQRFTPPLAWHDECFAECAKQETSNPGHLNLLQVCQQVYLEARLVPFSANTFVFEQRLVLERFFIVQGWERGLALRRVIFMHLLDSDYGLHHLIPNVRHVSMFVLLYRRTDNRTRERSYIRTFAEYRSNIHSLASAKVCLEFCGGYDADGLDWLNGWDFRTAESDIEDLLTKGTPLSARTLSLLES